MSSVHLEGVRFSYSTSNSILENVDLHLGDGWTGVVGGNGAGKTTLLSLIAGSIQPSSGCVRLDPANANTILCEQEVANSDDQVRTFARSDRAAGYCWKLSRDSVVSGSSFLTTATS